MLRSTENAGGWRGSSWRIIGWGGAALVLLLPLVLMQFTEEVNWSAGDFAFAFLLVVTVGLAFELALRRSGDLAYRAGVGVALGAALLLIWANAAVGILGSENNDANLLYYGVLVVGIVGALLARFSAPGMARAMLAAALAVILIAAMALAAGWGSPVSGPLEIAGLNSFFAALFVASAFLFRKAAERS